MRLYFTRNDPEHTILMSGNGTIHYEVDTVRPAKFSAPTLCISRPPGLGVDGDTFVAEVQWRRGLHHPVVRSHIFDGTEFLELEVRDFLFKIGRHRSHTRYFLGNDEEQYMWKPVKGVGYVLYHCKTRREIARPLQEMVTEGFFRGQKKYCLAVEPTTLDIDVVVLTFMIMEKRRRDRVTADCMKLRNQDEDVTAEGGCETEMSGGTM
ncbi:hypothetical protein LXA43DRAFT_902032 [Ganoderma leucocontextum]|nr:hypothetical protein LXA43DRAFT_902032 [Ganoderma leucocontextum]